ncbi:MAG: type II toxin-antitoxin system MqsA family antitoxin [Azoarcus sp.]|jgi:HTH-type transcriptional regulator/antitoxin MqsA|nr:type II toxin-antitoxin system MqsA family antitoxin [Azoarcus sp.]
MKHFCLHCDDGTVMELTVKDVTVSAENVTRVVPEVAGWHCPKCGEIEFVDEDGSSRHIAALEAAWAQARAGDALDIRAKRKKLKLTQAEAAQLFGGGANAFSRYELGKAQPHKSTLILLYLLEHHPELMPEVRAVVVNNY